jgi:hypothetical protein
MSSILFIYAESSFSLSLSLMSVKVLFFVRKKFHEKKEKKKDRKGAKIFDFFKHARVFFFSFFFSLFLRRILLQITPRRRRKRERKEEIALSRFRVCITR